jgi:hypothetical protein
MITSRTLPPDEWSKVAAIEPFASGGLPDPAYWRIVVVERDEVIVACCSLFDAVHWDCFWIAEADQKNPVVVRELVEGGVGVMDDLGIDLVHTTVAHDRQDLQDLLIRLGFSRAPGDLFYFKRGG